MDKDERYGVEMQRALLSALLGPYRSILEKWMRQFVLYEFGEAQGTSSDDIAEALHQRLVEEEELLEPALPEEARDYFLAARDDGVLAEANEDVWYSVDVALKHASFREVGPREED